MGEVGIASSSLSLSRSLARCAVRRCTVGVDKARWLQAIPSPVTVCSTARYMTSAHARPCPSFTAGQRSQSSVRRFSIASICLFCRADK